MGAVPSRESLMRGFFQLPDCGRRHGMVLIPLIEEFFPSPDCLLLRQLLETRKDPFVHYNHCYDEGFARHGDATGPEEVSCTAATDPLSSSSGQGPSSAPEPTACDAAAAAASVAEAPGGGEDKWRDDQYTPLDCTLEEFYQTYVRREDDLNILDTDKQMFELYAKDPRALRPVPCAIAFTSSCPCAHTASNNEVVQDDGGGGGGLMDAEGKGEGHAGATTATVDAVTTGGNDILRESTLLFGMQLQVVGLVADVSRFNRRTYEGATSEGALQLQMFLSKSVGDQNVAYAFLAALYTYVRQWREALAGLMGNRECENLSQNRAWANQHELGFLTSPTTVSNEQLWHLPPISAVITATRRTNIPILCFYRCLRAVLLRVVNMVKCGEGSEAGDMGCFRCAAHDRPSHHTDGRTTREPLSTLEGFVRGFVGCIPTENPEKSIDSGDVLHMWLDNSKMITHIPEEVVACAVVCIAQCADCQDCTVSIIRPRRPTTQAADTSSTSKNRRRNAPRRPKRSTAPSIVDTGSYPATGLIQTFDGFSGSATSAGPAKETGAQVGHVTADSRGQENKLRGALGQSIVVEAWPEDGIDLIAISDSLGRPADHQVHPHWVVGPSEKAQRTAAASLALWRSSGRSVVTENDLGLSGAKGCTGPRNGSGAMEGRMGLGEVLSLVADLAAGKGDGSWVLKRAKHPVEELLLSELHNGCRLAREADVHSPNWVRYTDNDIQKSRAPPVVLSSIQLGDNTIGDSAAFAAAVNQLVGEGSLCLWRVRLSASVARVVAVSPYFLRPPRGGRVRGKTGRRRGVKQWDDITRNHSPPAVATTAVPTAGVYHSTNRRPLGRRAAPRRPKPARRHAITSPTEVIDSSSYKGTAAEVGGSQSFSPAHLSYASFGDCRSHQQPIQNISMPSFDAMTRSQLFCQHTAPVPLSPSGVAALSHSHQSNHFCFNHSFFDTALPPFQEVNQGSRRHSTPFTSSHTTLRDANELTYGTSHRDTRRQSNRSTSHAFPQRISLSSFSNFSHLEDDGSFWSHSAADDRLSVTRHSSFVSNNDAVLNQSFDSCQGPVHPRPYGRGECSRPSAGTCRSFLGATSNSVMHNNEGISTGINNPGEDTPTLSGCFDDSHTDQSPVRLTVTIRHGLPH